MHAEELREWLQAAESFVMLSCGTKLDWKPRYRGG
jgi:hypothetical protein